MTVFERRGHWRTNANGTSYWVSAHVVRRDHWDIQGLQTQYGSAVYRASDFLRRSNVGRGAQGCFVNPNARCPVCGVPVFYYQNSFGSRVYFDDLGPPWPKHPCTDNPVPKQGIVHDPWKPITQRNKGEIQEIIEAANQTGLLRSKRFGEYSAAEWSLVLVEEVLRSGELHLVKGYYIDSAEHRRVEFSFYSEQSLLESGDMVSVKGREVSFFNRKMMTPVFFRSGDRILAVAQPSLEQQTDGKPERPTQQDGTGQTDKHRRPFNPRQFHRRDMKAHEHIHFFKKEHLRRAFVERLRPIVERMIPEGTRTPEEFTVRLNARRERTAANAEWTSRLTRFLLSYIFEGDPKPTGKSASRKQTQVPQTKGMTVPSARDFFGPGISFETLITRIQPQINRLKARGITDPGEISRKLNEAKLYAANGSKWTRLAIEILLDLKEHGINSDMGVQAVLDSATHQSNKKPSPPVPGGKAPTSSAPLNRDEIARRLAALGRISLKEDQR
jgi:hypothetical protein